MVALSTSVINVNADFCGRTERREKSAFAFIWQLLDQVKDPEIPVISIYDLGVLHDVDMSGGTLRIIITPTYSGCPAIDAIEEDIAKVLTENGVEKFSVITTLQPAWHTGLISSEGRKQLLAYGIAPPMADCDLCANAPYQNIADLQVACPRCASIHTRCVSEFGATACKALFQCNDCDEPFDYFKSL